MNWLVVHELLRDPGYVFLIHKFHLICGPEGASYDTHSSKLVHFCGLMHVRGWPYCNCSGLAQADVAPNVSIAPFLDSLNPSSNTPNLLFSLLLQLSLLMACSKYIEWGVAGKRKLSPSNLVDTDCFVITLALEEKMRCCPDSLFTHFRKASENRSGVVARAKQSDAQWRQRADIGCGAPPANLLCP